MNVSMASDGVTIPKWLWGGIGGVLLLVAGSMGTWVGATLVSHEARISRSESKIDSTDNRLDRIEDKLDLLIEAVHRRGPK